MAFLKTLRLLSAVIPAALSESSSRVRFWSKIAAAFPSGSLTNIRPSFRLSFA